MPRDKKFNKRGGGQRLDAQSAEEIEQRNQRLAEFEERRAARRADEDDDDDDEGGEDGADQGAKKEESSEAVVSAKPSAGGGGGAKVKGEKPVQQTSAFEHKKNLAKLEEVRKRREEAEARRKAEEEAEVAVELQHKAKIAALEDEDDDGEDKKKKKKTKAAIPKLSKIEIKKMKPAQMKDALKERGLDIQGNAKALTARLVEYEENR